MLKPFINEAKTPLEIIAKRHSNLISEFPKVYFELASMRRTGPNAFLTTEDIDDNTDRQILKHRSAPTLKGALQLLAGAKVKETKLFNDVCKIYAKIEQELDYAYFILYAKPQEGWVLMISDHDDPSHFQYRSIVSVKSDNVYGVLKKALKKLRSTGH